MEPLVSIITPSYNAEKYISQTLSSICNQSYLNWELIVFDDGSSDRTIQIITKFIEKDSRIQLFKNETNQGAAISRNKATEKAKGKYIAFLDADDLWHETKLSKQVLFMEKNNILVSYTAYVHIDESGILCNKRIQAMPTLSYNKQRKNNYIGNLTGMYNAEELGKIYVPNIRKRQDWALWLEAIKRSKKPAKSISEDLAYYRVHNQGISANKTALLKYNYLFYREYLKYSTLKSIVWTGIFLWEYFTQRPKWIKTYK